MATSQIRSRKDSRLAGLKRYFTGRPCPRGHVAERYTSSQGCVACAAERFAAVPPENKRAYVRHYRTGGKYRDYLARTRIERIARAAKRAAANPDATRESKRRWNRKNAHLWRDYYVAHQKRCRAAAPKWLTKEQRAEIRAIYQDAATRAGGPWEVDHIVPLKGRGVCGLHVPWNLRVIPQSENRAKGNKLIAY